MYDVLKAAPIGGIHSDAAMILILIMVLYMKNSELNGITKSGSTIKSTINNVVN